MGPAFSKAAALAAAVLLSGCLFDNNTNTSDRAPLAGGSSTIFDESSEAFSLAAPNLSPTDLLRHQSGDRDFGDQFVTAPSPVNPGLGPLFDNVSCLACHARDGRGRPPDPGQPLVSMLFRISQGNDPLTGPIALPGFGVQLQTQATLGDAPEGTVSIAYHDSTVPLADTVVTLRVPQYALQSTWTPLTATPLLSPRVAPAIFGLGLLEAVSESDILSRSDPTDKNGDGISGRPNYVQDARTGKTVLGRFGWKAGQPTLEQQSAGAYNQDMGVTNILFPAENCQGDRPNDSGCAAHGLDVDSATLEDVVFYMQSVAVPGRRDWDDPQVQQGEKLFSSIGCAACHVPELRTGSSSTDPRLSGQTIHPYTDLLLHDMGPGLADGRPDYLASGSEWRTAPLWGIGLQQVVNGHTFFLHDGRARNMLEAILWHGGEADKAKKAAGQLTPDDRQALLAFLQSL